MAKATAAELGHLFEDIETDKIGVVRLDDWRDTPLWPKVQNLLPGAESIVVLAQEVFPEVVKHLTPKVLVGEMALRDLYNRNSEIIGGHLDWEAYKMVKRLHRQGFKGLPLPACGSPYEARFLESPLSYGHAAQAAGLGVLGWHSMLITPEYGPRVRLACVITDALLKPSAPSSDELPCAKCDGACIKICPVTAITKPQGSETCSIDKYACSTYLNASGNCAQCLKVCPVGKMS